MSDCPQLSFPEMKQPLKSDGKGRDLFLVALGNSKLPEMVREYDFDSLLRRAIPGSVGNYSGLEVLVCALANLSTGNDRHPSDDVVERIMVESSRLAIRYAGPDTPLLSNLRVVRATRPDWLTCPIYQSILAPFEDEVEEVVGFFPREIFPEIAWYSSQTGTWAPIPAALLALSPDLMVPWQELTEPSRFDGVGFLQIGPDIATLRYKLAETTYRYLCRTLAKRLGRFTDRKGDRIEEVVFRMISGAARGWTWYRGYSTALDSGREKDLLGIGGGAGIALECKALSVRATSTDWSVRNLASDLKPLLYASDQIQAPIELIEKGGMIVTKAGKRLTLPRSQIGFGIVVTDEVATPVIDAYASSLDANIPGGFSRPFFLSVFDLSFTLGCSGGLGCFMDYFSWVSGHPEVWMVDVPESWFLYCSVPLYPLPKPGCKIIAELNYYEREPRGGLSEFSPPWLARAKLVEDLNLLGKTLSAYLVVQEDRTKAESRSRSRPEGPGVSDFWRTHPSLLDRTSLWTHIFPAVEAVGPKLMVIRDDPAPPWTSSNPTAGDIRETDRSTV